MENFAQENETKELIQQDSDSSEVEDIQFEEIVDIDEIQKKLQEKIYQNDSEVDLSESLEHKPESEIEPDKSASDSQQTALSIANSQIKIDPNAKKYVVYVDPDNIDFMENLSINERKSIINKILKEQNALAIKTKELNARKRFLKHAILACFTFIIGFPLMFICVNKALEATINNYELARENFMKLYKEKGKIKVQEQGPIKNIKY